MKQRQWRHHTDAAQSRPRNKQPWVFLLQQRARTRPPCSQSSSQALPQRELSPAVCILALLLRHWGCLSPGLGTHCSVSPGLQPWAALALPHSRGLDPSRTAALAVAHLAVSPGLARKYRFSLYYIILHCIIFYIIILYYIISYYIILYYII